MQDNDTTKHPQKGKHLTFKERELIEAWKKLPQSKSNFVIRFTFFFQGSMFKQSWKVR